MACFMHCTIENSALRVYLLLLLLSYLFFAHITKYCYLITLIILLLSLLYEQKKQLLRLKSTVKNTCLFDLLLKEIYKRRFFF